MSTTRRPGSPRLPRSSSQVKYLNKNESLNYSTVDAAENVTAGSVLSRLVALDPDTGAQLQYRLDTARCGAVLYCAVLYCTVLYCTAGAEAEHAGPARAGGAVRGPAAAAGQRGAGGGGVRGRGRGVEL